MSKSHDLSRPLANNGSKARASAETPRLPSNNYTTSSSEAVRLADVTRSQYSSEEIDSAFDPLRGPSSASASPWGCLNHTCTWANDDLPCNGCSTLACSSYPSPSKMGYMTAMEANDVEALSPLTGSYNSFKNENCDNHTESKSLLSRESGLCDGLMSNSRSMNYYSQFSYYHTEKGAPVTRSSACLHLGSGKIFTFQRNSPQELKILMMFEKIDFSPFKLGYHGWQRTKFGREHEIHILFSPPKVWPKESTLAKGLTRIAAEFPGTECYDEVAVETWEGSTWTRLGLAKKVIPRYPTPEQEWFIDLASRDPRQFIAFTPFRKKSPVSGRVLTRPFETSYISSVASLEDSVQKLARSYAVVRSTDVVVQQPTPPSSLRLMDPLQDCYSPRSILSSLEILSNCRGLSPREKITKLIMSQKDYHWKDVRSMFDKSTLPAIRQRVRDKTRSINISNPSTQLRMIRIMDGKWTQQQDCKLRDLFQRIPTAEIMAHFPEHHSSLVSAELELLEGCPRAKLTQTQWDEIQTLITNGESVFWMNIRTQFPGVAYEEFRHAWYSTRRRLGRSNDPGVVLASFYWDGDKQS